MTFAAVDIVDQWSNLSALGCLICCVIWGLTKGFPSLVDKFTEETARQRTDFKEEIQAQRTDFRTALVTQRQHFRVEMATTRAQSVEALNNLATHVQDLTFQITKEI